MNETHLSENRLTLKWLGIGSYREAVIYLQVDLSTIISKGIQQQMGG